MKGCNCIYSYYESDTNYWECTCPECEEEEEKERLPDCPHQYSIDDAKADAKYGSRDKY